MKKNPKAEFLKETFLREDEKLSPRRIDRAVEALGTSPEPSEAPGTSLNRFYDYLNIPRPETVSMGQNKASRRMMTPARIVSLTGGMLALVLCVSLTFFGISARGSKETKPEAVQLTEYALCYEATGDGVAFSVITTKSDEKKPQAEEPPRNEESRQSGELTESDASIISYEEQQSAALPVVTDSDDAEFRAQIGALIGQIMTEHPGVVSEGEGDFCLSVSSDFGFYSLYFPDEEAALGSGEELALLWQLLKNR